MVPPLWEGTLLLFNPWTHGFVTSIYYANNVGFLMITSISVIMVYVFYECIDGFILRKVVLLYLLIYCIALLPINTPERSFNSDASA